MNKHLKGFTILELMIVMVIIIFIMALGIAGLVSFRNNLDLENVYSDTNLAIKTVENYARNSRVVDERGGTTVDPIVAEYYIIAFTVGAGTSDYSLQYLEALNTAIKLMPNESNKNLNNTAIEYKVEAFGGLRVTDCQNIGFRRSTNELVAIRIVSATSQVILEQGRCELTISRKSVSTPKKIIFDIDKNTVN